MVCYSPLALDTNTPPASDKGRSPSIAALLSFIWPGLGQLYAGNRRLAAIFFVPTLILVPLLAYQLRSGAVAFGARFLEPVYVLGALILLIVIGVWRLVSVTQPFVEGKRHLSSRPAHRAVLAALAAIIVLTHGAGSYLLADAYNAENQIYGGGNDLVDDSPIPSDVPTLVPSQVADGTQDQTPSPTPSPTATEAPDGRVTMLFAGKDASPSSGLAVRSGTHYDSIMVVSYDPKANSVQMVSVPREFAGYPLYYGGKVPLSESYEITYMQAQLSKGNIKSPPQGDPEGRFGMFVREVQYLVGIHIDYWAVMDLDGFMKMIAAVGGIDVNNPSVIQCAGFFWIDGTKGLYIGAGMQHLNGMRALAYARERTCDSDYKRAARQQQVMRALLSKMSQPGAVLQIPGLIQTVGKSVQVSKSFKTSMVADYVAAAVSVPDANFTNVVLSPPTYASNTPNASICPNMPVLAAESIKLFGTDSLWSGKAKPRNVCP